MKRRHSRYLEILDKMQDTRREVNDGETQIVTDSSDMLKIEKHLQDKFLKNNFPEDFGNIGVVFENP